AARPATVPRRAAAGFGPPRRRSTTSQEPFRLACLSGKCRHPPGGDNSPGTIIGKPDLRRHQERRLSARRHKSHKKRQKLVENDRRRSFSLSNLGPSRK